MTTEAKHELREQATGILHCPFCGGTASVGTVRIGSANSPSPITEVDGTNRWIGYFVNCNYCQANNNGITHGYQTETKAVEAWNKRVAAAQE